MEAKMKRHKVVANVVEAFRLLSMAQMHTALKDIRQIWQEKHTTHQRKCQRKREQIKQVIAELTDAGVVFTPLPRRKPLGRPRKEEGPRP
jgi:hypothetical protein